MKRSILFALAIALLGACSTKERDIQTPVQDDVVFYASFEQPAEDETRVYANEDLLLRWTADDRVSIFNKLTYNQEYKFTGQTGANAGGFKKVDNDEFVTGNAISHVVSVYPYQEATAIAEDEVISLTLPAEQKYAENTFGLGANTMVSVSEDNVLQYKNVGGYLMLKLYGDNVSVSSITLKGNDGEKLAGKATVTMPLDGIPSVTMSSDATTEITLTCTTPIQLGATEDNCTQFWFVVPPVSFNKGFTVTVMDSTNGVFEKTTEKSLEIARNKLARMSSFEVVPEPSDEAIVFADEKIKSKLVAVFDTNSDGEISYKEAASVTSISSVFGDEKSFTSFDEFQYFVNVNDISANCFKDWSLLKSIILPKGVNKIRNSAFEGCSSLISICIPDGVRTINPFTFSSCSSLSSIILPKSIVQINKEAFRGCSSLSSIDIPAEVKYIGQGAFYECSGLTSVSIPEGVSLIGSEAFGLCGNLKSINIPTTLSSVGWGAFEGCTGLEAVHITNLEKWVEIQFEGTEYDGTIDASSNPLNYAKHLFLSGKELDSIIFPSSVKSICDFAFIGCEGLSSVSCPSVTSIGKGAFLRCVNLGVISMPSVSSIGDFAFSRCSSLVSINIPSSAHVGSAVLSDCTSLVDINGGKELIDDGRLVAVAPVGLKTYRIPDGVTEIDNSACYRIPDLVSIFIPSSVTTIGTYAFGNCHSLTSLVIPEGVTSIGNCAFWYCQSLSTIHLPSTLRELYYDVFSLCSRLQSVYIEAITPPIIGPSYYSPFTFPNKSVFYVPGESLDAYKNSEYWREFANRIFTIDSQPQPNNTIYYTTPSNSKILTTYDEKAFNATIISNEIKNGRGVITFDGDVTSIGDNAFIGSVNLTSISIPHSVTHIGVNAFNFCPNLLSITIPARVSSIGYGAFSECSNMLCITILPETPPIGSLKMFDDTNSAIILVPSGSVESYKTADYWESYSDRIQAIL